MIEKPLQLPIHVTRAAYMKNALYIFVLFPVVIGSLSVGTSTHRQEFCSDLNEFMSSAQYKVIASVIRKDVLARQAPDTAHNIYELGTMFGLKRLLTFFDRHDQRLPATITFEARGRREDGDLCFSFLELMQQQKFSGRFDIKILPKIANCCGLQLADLIARPIGRHALKPTQPNRAYEILRDKMDSYQGSIDGYGLEIFP